MWNQSESDRRYYKNREIESAKHLKAVSKAAYRGIVSEEWHKHNRLTAETLPIFKKVMKQADKEWEKSNELKTK